MLFLRTIANKSLNKRLFSYAKYNIPNPNPNEPYNLNKILLLITIGIMYKTFNDKK